MKKRLLIAILVSAMAMTGMTACRKNTSDNVDVEVNDDVDEEDDDREEAEETKEKPEKEASDSLETVKDVIKDAIEDKIEESADEEVITTDYSAYYDIYSDTLDSWCLACDSLFQDGAAETSGAMEAAMGAENPDDIYDSIGYVLYDINKDDVPELLITETGVEAEGYQTDYLMAAYAIDGNNEVKTLFEGWARSRYSVMNNGELFYIGSGGADYTTIAIYSVDGRNASLKVEDYYFTTIKDDGDFGVFHNFTGSEVIEESDDITDNSDAFELLWEEGNHRCIKFAVSLLKNYRDTKQIEVRNQYAVIGKYAQNAGVGSFAKDTFMCATTPNAYIDLLATEEVSDLKVLKISIKDVNADGSLVYDSEELYSQDKLTVDRSLMIGVTFMGDMPEYAISYKTKNGNKQTFSLYVSGYDGSIAMSELK